MSTSEKQAVEKFYRHLARMRDELGRLSWEEKMLFREHIWQQGVIERAGSGPAYREALNKSKNMANELSLKRAELRKQRIAILTLEWSGKWNDIDVRHLEPCRNSLLGFTSNSSKERRTIWKLYSLLKRKRGDQQIAGALDAALLAHESMLENAYLYEVSNPMRQWILDTGAKAVSKLERRLARRISPRSLSTLELDLISFYDEANLYLSLLNEKHEELKALALCLSSVHEKTVISNLQELILKQENRIRSVRESYSFAAISKKEHAASFNFVEVSVAVAAHLLKKLILDPTRKQNDPWEKIIEKENKRQEKRIRDTKAKARKLNKQRLELARMARRCAALSLKRSEQQLESLNVELADKQEGSWKKCAEIGRTLAEFVDELERLSKCQGTGGMGGLLEESGPELTLFIVQSAGALQSLWTFILRSYHQTAQLSATHSVSSTQSDSEIADNSELQKQLQVVLISLDLVARIEICARENLRYRNIFLNRQRSSAAIKDPTFNAILDKEIEGLSRSIFSLERTRELLKALYSRQLQDMQKLGLIESVTIFERQLIRENRELQSLVLVPQSEEFSNLLKILEEPLSQVTSVLNNFDRVFLSQEKLCGADPEDYGNPFEKMTITDRDAVRQSIAELLDSEKCLRRSASLLLGPQEESVELWRRRVLVARKIGDQSLAAQAEERMRLYESFVSALKPPLSAARHNLPELPQSFQDARSLVEKVELKCGLVPDKALQDNSLIFAFSLFDRIVLLLENLSEFVVEQPCCSTRT